MIEKEINNKSLLKSTFISRFNIPYKEIYSKERYLTVIMRNSIIEKLFTKFFFQTETKNFDLYPLIENLKKKEDLLKKFQERLNIFHDIYKKGEPLYLLSELSDEISKLLKEDLSNIKIDKFIIKIEYLLSQHFENNFYEYQIEQQMNNNFFNSMYLQKEITNFNYSIESLNSIFKFLNIFEKQSLSTKIENEFPLINNYFCSEKIYYFYCDTLGREKRPSGNIIHYLLSQLFSKFDLINNAKVNNPQLENYILLNLFIIDKIISDYSFYLTKKPELTDIFDKIKELKSWPIPIGNKCVDTLDNIINECSFQGITILNKIRERYFIDFLDEKIQSIETKYFIGCIIVINHEWDEKHYDSMISENPDDFNLIKFIERIINKKRNKHTNKLNLKELVLKILITIIFNSFSINYNDENLRNIYQKYLPKYKSIYKQKNEKLNESLIESENNNNLIDDNDKEEEIQQSNIKKSLDKLLKIIDFGFDESIENFSEQINLIAEKLINENIGISDLIEEEEEETILNCDAFLPITSFRNYLKPTFLEMKKLFKINNKNDKSELDLFNYYKNSFEFVVKNYYPKFLLDYNDELLNNNNDKLRKNFYFNYKINIILIEDKNSISYFIENLNKKVYNKIEEKISDEDFFNFWKYFIEKKSDFKINYLLHIVPHYEHDNENPFRIIEEGDNLENNQNYLSEYIASNDSIYKNLVFMPFASNSDPTFFSFIPNCQNSEKDVLEFPSLDCMYTFLKKPLDYYISDSNGILELNLHKIIINNDEELSKIFYKNVELISTDIEIKSTLILYGVNYLGIEDKNEEKIEINMDGPFMIKVFNIFFKKDVPFNYNMQSNTDWIEVFLNDKYDKIEVDKYCKYSSFVIKNKQNKYYEEFNIPQTNFQPIFKNFKVKKLELKINKPTLEIKYDDNQIFNYQNNIKNEPKNKDFKIDILISKFEKENEIQKIPIATFISI